jgi:ATP-binding cassette subfamily B protein
LYQNYEFHINQNSSSSISEIVNDLNSTLSVIYNALSFITQILVVIFIVGTLLLIYPVAAIGMIVFVGISYYFVMRISKARLLINGQILVEGHAKLMQILHEALGGIRDVLVDGTQKTFIGYFRDVDIPIRKANVDNLFIRMAPRFVLESIGISLLAILAAISAWEADTFGEVLPLLGTMAIAANRLLPAIQATYASLAGIHGSQASLTRTLLGLKRAVSDDANLGCEVSPFRLNNRLVFKNVWFKYDVNNTPKDLNSWVLKNINIEIAANTTVAFVGSTGSGKSTVADIALGLLKPQRGELIVDNCSLNDLDQRAWRAGIAHVPQNIFLSDGTFIQNIAFGVSSEEVDILKVKRAAKMACLSDFIESRRNGYHDLIGEKGLRLSGGQRQRIGIARALYKSASLIIFDEATSALDNVTEREVMKTIRDLSDNVTIILIAHRISTIENADLIYEIGNGEVLNAGTFSELLRISPSFRAMALPCDSL